MTSFESFWSKLCGETPQLNNPETKMKITVRAFKRAQRQAFEAGCVAKRPTPDESKKAARDFGNVGERSVFDKIFGNSFKDAFKL